jgi:DNA-binding transcriptional LysR family regulator
MERLRRIAEFWGWLPAFRAVAETKHLPTASKLLHVSPSALSRTIRLVETSVGKPLFDREGRSLRLNEAGERLLAAARDAMRRVDEGLSAATSSGAEGPLHVSAPALVVPAVLPAVERLRAAHPGLVPCIYHHPASEVNALLLRGQIDVAFLLDPIPDNHLEVEAAGVVANGIYCGRAHPLFKKPRPRLADVLDQPFVVLTDRARGPASDGWPVTVSRKVRMYTSQLQVALEVCASGAMLAVLPTHLEATTARTSGLRRLSIDLVPRIELYAVRRESIAPSGIVEALIEAVRRGSSK